MNSPTAVVQRYWQNRRLQSMVWFLLMLVPASAKLTGGDSQAQYLTLAIYFALAMGWVFVITRRHLPIVLPRFLLPLLAYVGLMLALLPLSPVRSHAWEIVSDLAELSLCSVVLFTLFPRAVDPRPLEDGLLSLGVLFSLANLAYVGIAMVSWVSVGLRYDQLPPFGYRLPGAFLGHPNLEAGFLNLLLPFVMVRVLAPGRTSRRVLWSCVFGLFLVIEYFSSSRAGWAAGAVGLAVTGAVWVTHRHQRRMCAERFRGLFQTLRRRWQIVLGFVLLAAVGSALIWLQSANTPHKPLAQARSTVWSAGLAIFRDSPIIGHGPGSTHLLVMTADRFLTEPYFIHPHNLVLYLADEGGALASLITLSGLLLLALFLRDAHGRMSPADYLLEAAGIGALATVALHNQADILFETPVYSLSVVVIILLVWSKQLSMNPKASVTIPSWIMFPLLATWLVGQVFLLRGIGEIQRGVDLFIKGDQRTGTEVLCAGAKIQNEYAEGHFTCALAHAVLNRLGDHPNDQQAAIAEFTAGLRLDPFLAHQLGQFGRSSMGSRR